MRTLGNVRLRDEVTNEIILTPKPSADPNDPLNWPQWYKYYMAGLICIAMMMCNFLAAGPSIALVETAVEFFPAAAVEDGVLNIAVAKTAYFFTTTALLQGVGNFFWVPMANKFGRRPVYVASYTVYLACTIWLIFEHSFAGFLAGRIVLGFGAGAAETIAPISIADVFFLHERGTIMALYTAFLSAGVGFGVVISGLITKTQDWRVIYQVSAALIGVVLALAIFTFPETAYERDGASSWNRLPSMGGSKPGSMRSDAELGMRSLETPVSPKKAYFSALKIFNRTLTQENLLKLSLRPLGLIILPPVLWAALVQAVTVGFLVAVSSNVGSAFYTAYGFDTWQSGLCFIAGIIGALVGIPAGGHLGDQIADWFTRRNGGVRDPEMRLPGMAISMITTPLALVLYGVGVEHKLHWICPTVGLGLLTFSISQGTNICLVYVIDAYRPVAGEVTLAVMGFKSLFGFLLSFYTNSWVEKAGYQNAFGAMAGISTVVLVMWMPLFVWGKAIRYESWKWPIVSHVHWSEDREVGE
ncbi:putative MFS-type transporter C1271.10c-like protein 5 [Colletotrichum chlorophyti]|uniref:Putative MFS-type transporter C1271.10c-like protein 5 n=1 Tax=Colletotrichum chlorophyti TaxID=708187 RepID=A0A1Q8RVH5_9PEZI|nr:putative MFS-type transporter C1271.10c-like protein 5 [Colletotrichum chlorophyti]